MSKYSNFQSQDELQSRQNEAKEARKLILDKKRRDEEMAQKALQEEMITKAQQAADEAEAEAARDKMQLKLNETAALLSELSQTQNERLSQKPPPHLAAIAQPSDKEADLANQVTDSLVKMAKQVHPNDVVSTGAVRNAMGITITIPKKNRHDLEAAGKSTVTQKSDQASGQMLSPEGESGDSGMEGHEDSENEPIRESRLGERMEDAAADLDFNSGLGDL